MSNGSSSSAHTRSASERSALCLVMDLVYVPVTATADSAQLASLQQPRQQQQQRRQLSLIPIPGDVSHSLCNRAAHATPTEDFETDARLSDYKISHQGFGMKIAHPTAQPRRTENGWY